MAGSLAIVAREHAEKLATAIREGWEVEFSRFFSYPPSASTCPNLVPLPHYVRSRRPLGTWITSSSSAWLQLVHGCSNSAVILTVFLGGKMQEEHHVSKLVFSWPQSSCVSGFPARGTRAVLVSYRDCVGEIQKFALRFSTICETEAFLNAIKEILKGANDIGRLSNEFGSAISSQNQTPEKSLMTPVLAYTPELPASSYLEAEQHSCIQQNIPTHKFQSNFPAFPPSFTSLLTGYSPSVEQAAANPTAYEENALKSQLAKYMEDSSFQDMLVKVEKVMNELGGDLTL